MTSLGLFLALSAWENKFFARMGAGKIRKWWWRRGLVTSDLSGNDLKQGMGLRPGVLNALRGDTEHL